MGQLFHDMVLFYQIYGVFLSILWCDDINISFDNINNSWNNINILRSQDDILRGEINTLRGKIDIWSDKMLLL